MDWQGRRTLVTGAGGFIGGHLAVALAQAGARVRALCRYNSRGDRGTLAWFEPAATAEIEVVFGDLRDPDAARRAVDGSDTVFHLGALIGVPDSFDNPQSFVATNVSGTLNVAQASLTAGVERMLHVSTSEVYGEVETLPIAETHRLSASSPYAASKIAADMVIHSLGRAFGLPASIARPFNTYGPHQSARAIVPAIAIQALEGGRVRLGRLDPRRDLTFVGDTVAGLMSVAGSDETRGEVVHLGSERDVSVSELVELIGEIVGRDLEVELEERRVRPGESEIPRLLCDCTKVHALTGWRAQRELRSGLEETVAWLARNRERYSGERYAT